MRTSCWVAILGSLLALGCAKSSPVTTPPTDEVAGAEVTTEDEAPRRTILFIGDGMGVGQLTAATYLNGGPLAMFAMPHMAWVTTHEYEFLTTESASAATALSTGRKTHYEAVSTTPGTTEANEEDPARHMQTLLELASSLELGTGMVATSRIMHATPAAFAAHRYHRHQYEGITQDIVSSGLDVLMGAGYEAMKFGENDYWAVLGVQGWFLATSPKELAARPADATRVAALFHPQNMPFVADEEARGMSLSDMVDTTIEILDAGHPQGWVLMVEGSFPDWCGHNLAMECAARETLDLDAAVGRALAYSRGRTDTLVVVTADHETGGLTVLDPERTAQFAKILGGEEKATAMAALPTPEGVVDDSPPPFQHMTVPKWNMDELADARATLVVGHFSMASRPYWTREGRFYGAHTPEMVATFAEGPGARAVAQARDNADLGQAIRAQVAAGAKGEKTARTPARTSRPKNVVLLIGDGLGISAVTGAYYYQGGLAMTELPHHGIVTTHALDGIVSDSPGTGTALSTGRRTRKDALGMVVENGKLEPIETVLEAAERKGIATGIVTTTSIVHATPAAFYAHRPARDETSGIVEDLLALDKRVPESDGIEVLFGGGRRDFDETARAGLAAAGYTVTEQWPADATGPLVALLAADALAPARFRATDGKPETPTLAELTTAALERLAQDEDGFFLVVEGGQIDWAQHEVARDTSVLDEVVDFDQAVAVAREFAASSDTLIIVTADHAHSMSLLDNHYGFESGRCGVAKPCGGPFEFIDIPVKGDSIRNGEGFADRELQGNYAPPRLHLQYPWPVQEAAFRVDVSAPHSANLVGVFAEGPWGSRLEGWVDQPEIGELLMDWVD